MRIENRRFLTVRAWAPQFEPSNIFAVCKRETIENRNNFFTYRTDIVRRGSTSVHIRRRLKDEVHHDDFDCFRMNKLFGEKR